MTEIYNCSMKSSIQIVFDAFKYFKNVLIQISVSVSKIQAPYQCYRRVDPAQKMLRGDGHFSILVVHLLVFSLKGKHLHLASIVSFNNQTSSHKSMHTLAVILTYNFSSWVWNVIRPLWSVDLEISQLSPFYSWLHGKGPQDDDLQRRG